MSRKPQVPDDAPKIDEKTGRVINPKLSETVRNVPWYFGQGQTLQHQTKRPENADGKSGAPDPLAAAIKADSMPKCVVCGQQHAARDVCPRKVRIIPPASVAADRNQSERQAPPSIGHDAQRRQRVEDSLKCDAEDPLLGMLEDELLSSTSAAAAAVAVPQQRTQLSDLVSSVAGSKKK